MKKTLIAVAAAAALTTSAFAEITFGSWLRVLAAPVANDGKDTVAAMGNSWGWGARVARLNVNAAAEDGNVGYDMGIYNDISNGLSTGDQWSIWAKPVETVKVSYGKYDNNTLRGDICYGSWNWLRPTSSWIAEDEGLLMSGNGGTGVLLEATPVDGLYIQALLPITTKAAKAEDVYKNIRGGFAYNIEGVGKIKAQLILKNTPKTEAVAAKDATYSWTNKIADDGTKSLDATSAVTPTWTAGKATDAVAAQDARLDKTIEAAFDLTSVENLYVGVGFQMNLLQDYDKTLVATMKDVKKEDEASTYMANFVKTKIALGATYQVSDELKVSASGAYFMYQKSGDDGADPRFQAGAGVDYNLGDGMNLSADVRYLSKAKAGGKSIDKSDKMAFCVGVTKGISSNGYMGVAFQAQTNSGNWANNVIEANAEKNDKLTWCVPVAISCWF